MFTKMYLLIIILALISLFICIQEENQQQEIIREPYVDHFVNHLVLPPLVAGRIRPFYRNNRKFYTDLYEKYSNIATKHMKNNGIV
jgi:hypothetical protein